MVLGSLQGPRQMASYSAVMHRAQPTRYLLLAVSLALAGCVGEHRPDDCDAEQVTIELTVRADALVPEDPAACRGQLVTLVLDSQVDGVFHIHGLDELVPASPISSGEELTLEFDAATSGQFPIELHPSDDPQGVTIGILTIHER